MIILSKIVNKMDHSANPGCLVFIFQFIPNLINYPSFIIISSIVIYIFYYNILI
jgi:hypothetical protein